ncbi:MAG: hypothetical protein LW768_07290 [Rubrivivax sp.]|nr:hypothetical protein [Rubrivivax sp.]
MSAVATPARVQLVAHSGRWTGEFKQRLAAAVSDPEAYAITKDPVFHLMAQAAEQWAAKTGWHAGASDG